MRNVLVYNQVSLDGYFTDANGDMSWAHRSDPEWNAYVRDNVKDSGGGELLFGRVTYAMMAGFWPTPAGKAAEPVVAEAMGRLSKIVFSRTLDKVSWENTRLVKTGPVEEVRRLKKEAGQTLVVMGSGSIVAQLAAHGLVDEYQLIVNPIVLGKGRTLFDGVERPFSLKLKSTRAFTNGNVVLTYGLA
jgi:dihydrofolate reductase